MTEPGSAEQHSPEKHEEQMAEAIAKGATAGVVQEEHKHQEMAHGPIKATEIVPPPRHLNMDDATDRAVKTMIEDMNARVGGPEFTDVLTSEGGGFARGAAPAAIALLAETHGADFYATPAAVRFAHPATGIADMMIRHFDQSKSVGRAADFAGKIGDKIGLATQFQEGAKRLISTGLTASILAGGTTFALSYAKRAALGETAFSNLARYSYSREDSGLFKRLLRGGEKWAVTRPFLRENRLRKQLIKYAQMSPADLDAISIGNRKRLHKLIAEGVLAGTSLHMMSEQGVAISPETQKRMEMAYSVTRQLLKRIPTEGEQNRVMNDDVNKIVRNREKMLFFNQTWRMAGVSALKAATGVGLLQAFSLGNIQAMKDLAVNGITTVGDWVKGVVKVGWSGVSDVAGWVNASLDSALKTGAAAVATP